MQDIHRKMAELRCKVMTPEEKKEYEELLALLIHLQDEKDEMFRRHTSGMTTEEIEGYVKWLN